MALSYCVGSQLLRRYLAPCESSVCAAQRPVLLWSEEESAVNQKPGRRQERAGLFCLPTVDWACAAKRGEQWDCGRLKCKEPAEELDAPSNAASRRS
jgi:hypothetical protein